ncbi:hypothetical protein MNV49_004568 [Pseudohyphozyma bogoriensis]|nr:hypothetical protein MNV49_004568 [Pseudohyphozyma bogoriensis]
MSQSSQHIVTVYTPAYASSTCTGSTALFAYMNTNDRGTGCACLDTSTYEGAAGYTQIRTVAAPSIFQLGDADIALACDALYSPSPDGTSCIGGPTTAAARERRRSQLAIGNRCKHLGLTECPLRGRDFECIDTQNSLERCGGCSSVSGGTDCSSLPFVDTVECLDGECLISACVPGATLIDGECRLS